MRFINCTLGLPIFSQNINLSTDTVINDLVFNQYISIMTCLFK